MIRTIIVWCLLVSILQAQDFNLISGDITGVKPASTPARAIALAIADLGKIDEDSRPFQRYIWLPEPSKGKVGAVSHAVNAVISKSSVIIKPTPVANGQLLRCDLRTLAPFGNDVAKLLELWEKFGTEPYFHVTRTVDDALPTNAISIKLEPTDPPGSLRFKIGDELWFRTADKRFLLWNGHTWVLTACPHNSTQQISAYGAHCGLEQAVMFQGLTHSNAAIVRYDYFLTKALTTLDGGLYYDFMGFERKPAKGTAQDALLKSLGVSEKDIETLRSDQRSAIFRSKVTGKPRRLDIFQGPNVRPGVGTGLITLTHDFADGNIDPKADPIRNLLESKDDARELIAERPNGLHLFVLFDGKGNLQDAAPDNVVKDHTIPAPHTARLQPGISCIRCHGPDDGLKPFDNDVQTMRKKLDVFADLASKRDIPETLDRLAGLYTGDLTKAIARGRDDYNSAVYQSTGGYGVRESSATIASVYNDYNYDLVTPAQACKELGFTVPTESAVDYLNQMIPPLQKDILGIAPEDPHIGALLSGIGIGRPQFELIYADMAFRALQTLKAQQVEQTQK